MQSNTALSLNQDQNTMSVVVEQPALCNKDEVHTTSTKMSTVPTLFRRVCSKKLFCMPIIWWILTGIILVCGTTSTILMAIKKPDSQETLQNDRDEAQYIPRSTYDQLLQRHEATLSNLSEKEEHVQIAHSQLNDITLKVYDLQHDLDAKNIELELREPCYAADHS